MKKLFHVLAACAVFVSTVAPVFAVESIASFQSQIQVFPDSDLQITERILYTTTEEKHGIYRYIPERYARSGWNQQARIHVDSVADFSSEPIPYELSRESGNVVLKIGDPDTTFVGEQEYEIQYTVQNGVQFLRSEQVPDSDLEGAPYLPELYWDITGEGWQVPIASVAAEVRAPHAGVRRAQCYSGAYGGDDQLCQVIITDAGEAVQFMYTETISEGDNMTVAVQFDPTAAWEYPTEQELWWRRVRENALILPLFLPGSILVFSWWKWGRDREFVSWNVWNDSDDRPQRWAPLFSRRQVPFAYEPPTDLTPGQSGAMLDNRVDAQDVIAEILDLARKKFLRIEAVEKKKMLWGKETDYRFVRLKKSDSGLPEYQSYLLEHLFPKDAEESTLSELKGSFSTHFAKVQQQLMRSLVAAGYNRHNPTQTRGGVFGLAIILSGAGFVWSFVLLERGLYWGLGLALVSGVVSLALAAVFSVRTARGRNAYWRARGLKKMIQAGAWRQEIQEKHLFIEEVFPYAVAYGVVKKLSTDMEDLQVAPPEYLSNSALVPFTTAHFVQHFSETAAQSLSYNPNSGSYSSGSGFSGGFSGGGGGGGGGRSW